MFLGFTGLGFIGFIGSTGFTGCIGFICRTCRLVVSVRIDRAYGWCLYRVSVLASRGFRVLGGGGGGESMAECVSLKGAAAVCSVQNDP